MTDFLIIRGGVIGMMTAWQLAARLREETGIDAEYRRKGLLYLRVNDGDSSGAGIAGRLSVNATPAGPTTGCQLALSARAEDQYSR